MPAEFFFFVLSWPMRRVFVWDGTLCCCGAMVPPWLAGIVAWDTAGVTYKQVDTGIGHAVLLVSDGMAAVCGRNESGECSVPALSGGVIYTQVVAGRDFTALLGSDGGAVACGDNHAGRCSTPILQGTVVYEQVAVGRLILFCFRVTALLQLAV